MTVNLTHRNWTVAVGGKDFSPGRILLELSQDKATAQGFVALRGRLLLQEWQGLDESLDPHLNQYRWQTGQAIAITVADTKGVFQPLPFGDLFILNAAPSANDRQLELEVGDWFALEEWRSTEGVDEDPPEAGDTAIAVHPRQTLITDLLAKVEMTPAGTVPGDWIGDRVEGMQGGYIGLAGGIAYGAETPSLLWAHGKTARVTPIDVAPAAPWCQVVIGQGEAQYEPQTAEAPVETYICTCQGFEADDSDRDPDDPNCTVRTLLSDSAGELARYCVYPRLHTVEELYILREPELTINPDSGATRLVKSIEQHKTKYYSSDDDRLLSIVDRVLRPRISIFRAAAKENGFTVSDPLSDVTAQKNTVNWYYDSDLEVVTSIVEIEQMTQAELAPKYSAPANWSTLETSAKKVERWKRLPSGDWLYEVQQFRSRILANPQLVEELEERGSYDMLNIATNLVLVPQGGLSVSTSGQTQPPATEYFPDSNDGGYKPQTLEARAIFQPIPGYKRRPRETEEAIAFASSVPALKAAATIGGTMRIGRHKGRSLRIAIPDKFFTSWEPLRRIDVVESAAVKTYLSDGPVLVLDRTEAALFFPHMVWLGTAPAQGVTSAAGSALNVQNPHQFEIGQTVQFTPTPGGGLPPELEADRSYFVVSTTEGLQVSTTANGAPITVGALPPANPITTLPAPNPITGEVGPLELAYNGAPFAILPTVSGTSSTTAPPINPPFAAVPSFFAGAVLRFGGGTQMTKSGYAAGCILRFGSETQMQKGGHSAGAVLRFGGGTVMARTKFVSGAVLRFGGGSRVSGAGLEAGAILRFGGGCQTVQTGYAAGFVLRFGGGCQMERVRMAAGATLRFGSSAQITKSGYAAGCILRFGGGVEIARVSTSAKTALFLMQSQGLTPSLWEAQVLGERSPSVSHVLFNINAMSH